MNDFSNLDITLTMELLQYHDNYLEECLLLPPLALPMLPDLSLLICCWTALT